MATRATRSPMERLLDDVGVGPGMAVLDVGCGPGDVALLLAERVGATGRVVAIDRDVAALARAEERLRASSCGDPRVVRVDLAAPLPDLGSFDAIVGRRVLMYLPEPASLLRRLAGLLRPDGVVAFQEHDATMVPGGIAPLPLHDRVLGWIWRTVEREGGNPRIGFELPALFAAAGLAVDEVRAEAVIQGYGTHHPLAFVVRAILPRIVARGVATPDDIDVDTLQRRLDDERAGLASAYVSDMVFSAWSRPRSDESPVDTPGAHG